MLLNYCKAYLFFLESSTVTYVETNSTLFCQKYRLRKMSGKSQAFPYDCVGSEPNLEWLAHLFIYLLFLGVSENIRNCFSPFIQ